MESTDDRDAFSASLQRLLPGYVPANSLCKGEAPLFQHQNAVDWFLRTNYSQLVAARAVGKFMGRRIVHIERLREVAERVAVEAAK
jgi:hypothetical protein